MKRLIRRSCLFSLVAPLVAALGCGETTDTPRTSLTFDRPVDIAFACYGDLRITNGSPADITQPIEQTAMPTSACETRALPRQKVEDPLIVPFGQEDLKDAGGKTVFPPSWYGLVLESGPGTVNVVRFSIQTPKPSDADFDGTVIDSDPFTPGANGISVGEEPVAIVTDPAGCHAVTANAGSCDLSVLDLNSALDTNRGADVKRLVVKNSAGAEIRARPAAMVGQPSAVEVGNVCPAAPTGLVYVAYPSCHLVAGVDTSTGEIVAGVQYDAAGVPSIVRGNVTCPAECGGGGAVTPGVRPVALDLELDPRLGTQRLAIGADNSASITVVDLDATARPMSLFRVPLANTTGTLGVSALALSPQVGMGGGNTGLLDFVDEEGAGGAFQFVYAIATDGSVRVADVLDIRRECDTQVDPRFARKVPDVHRLACFPVGDPATPPRRPSAGGPGIRVPGGAIPLSVEFTRVDKLADIEITETRTADAPSTLIGYFAVIAASNGGMFLANVDDDDYPDLFQPGNPLSVSIELAMAHQLRDARGNRSLTIDTQDQIFDPQADPNDPQANHSGDDQNCSYTGRFDGTTAIGGPRATAAPERKVPAGSFATEKLAQLPGGRQLLCDRRARHNDPSTDLTRSNDHDAIFELMYAAPDAVRARSFPDLRVLPEAETWNMVWEGSLSLNASDGSVGVREGVMTVDSAGVHVKDDSKPFCAAGVEPFDILQLRGCDPTAGAAECPSGYTCFVHPASQLEGLGACMRSDEADRLAKACKDFLTSVRHYTVKTTASGELLAIPRRHELSTTPLDGCVSDNQCQMLATYAQRSTSPLHPVELDANPNAPTDNHTWSCVADPLRAPKAGTGKRCELRCDPPDPANPDRPSDCLAGTVCQGGVVGQPKSGFCMEGVVPPQRCVNAPQRYELHAGEAFAVVGSRYGFIHPVIEDAAGMCVRAPGVSPLVTGRLPLVPRAPAAPTTPQLCDPTADLETGQLPGGGFEPNPCLTTVPHTEAVPVYKAGVSGCVQDEVQVDNETKPRFNLVERQAPAVRFRSVGMNFTLVDPYYPGDATCIGDRQGTLAGQIPHVVPGYTLTFRQVGGFVPMQVFGSLGAENRPSFPVKVVHGPANTMWVVDEGDFLSTSSSSPSTRGKVLRLEPLAPTTSGAALK